MSHNISDLKSVISAIDAGEGSRGFECLDKGENGGKIPFVVHLRPHDQREWQKTYNQCTYIGFNKKSRRREDMLNEEKFNKRMNALMILGWDGLTVVGLRMLMPFKASQKLKDDTIIDYSMDNAHMLMEHSLRFAAWVNDQVMRVEEFYDERQEVAEENFSPTSQPKQKESSPKKASEK